MYPYNSENHDINNIENMTADEKNDKVKGKNGFRMQEEIKPDTIDGQSSLPEPDSLKHFEHGSPEVKSSEHGTLMNSPEYEPMPKPPGVIPSYGPPPEPIIPGSPWHTPRQISRPDDKLLDLILEFMQDALNDSKYYKVLANEMGNAKDREIVYTMHLDELKHYKYLEEIRYKMGGKRFPEMKAKHPHLERPLYENFEKRILEETRKVGEYRKLYFVFWDLEIRDILYEIITDKQRHASLCTMLYMKYK